MPGAIWFRVHLFRHHKYIQEVGFSLSRPDERVTVQEILIEAFSDYTLSYDERVWLQYPNGKNCLPSLMLKTPLTRMLHDSACLFLQQNPPPEGIALLSPESFKAIPDSVLKSTIFSSALLKEISVSTASVALPAPKQPLQTVQREVLQDTRATASKKSKKRRPVARRTQRRNEHKNLLIRKQRRKRVRVLQPVSAADAQKPNEQDD